MRSSSSRPAWATLRVRPSSIEPVFLLDTHIVSDLRRPERASERLLAWSRETPTHQQFISCITVFELELGIRQKERRDHAPGRLLREWLEDQVLPTFEGRILDTGIAVARRCAAMMHVPNPAPERDAWIAATALVRGLTVVSRNTRDFAACGAQVFNPWSAPV